MAIYQEDNRLKCVCGSDKFTEAEIIIVEKLQVSSTITKGERYKKTVINKGLRCTVCGVVIPDPTVC